MENQQLQTTRSVGRNVLYGFSTWFLPLGLSFYATPKIVNALGDQDYGIYALVLGFVGYSFNFSFGRAITKYIAEYRAVGDDEKIPDIISSAFFINILVGLLSVSVFCLTSRWLVESVFKIEPEAQNKATIALYTASTIIFFTMQNQIFSSILQGIHRFDVYSKIFNLNNFALLLGNLLLAVNGYGLLSLFYWNLTVTVLTCLIYAFAAKRFMPDFKLIFRFRGEILRLIIKYSAGIIGYQILSNFLLLFERGWISSRLETKSLTYYVVPMLLSFYIHGFISSLTLVLFPLSSELNKDKKKLLSLYTKATKIVCFFVFFLGTTLISESNIFLTLWMGPVFAEKTSVLLVIHTITYSLLAIQIVSWQMTEGLGYPSYNCYLFMICLIVSLSLMVGLTQNFGLEGIAFGRMAGYAAIFFSIFYVEKWFFGKVQLNFWAKILSVLLTASVFAAVIEKSIVEFFSISWLSFLTATVVGGVVYSLIVWILGFIKEDEKILFRHILQR
jgi:O-antigen/teichoic acid export membrane protein